MSPSSPSRSNNSPTVDGATGLSAKMGSCSLGTWLGVPVLLHYSFFILVVLAVIASIQVRSIKYSIYQFVLMGPILFITIVIHEFGHVLMARRLGGEAKAILLWPLGGLAISSQPSPATHKSSMLVAAAGPATHIIQIIFWVIYSALVGLATPTTYWGTSPAYIANGSIADFFVMIGLGAIFLNVSLLCFNLFLPAFPLDGGQIFASVLLMHGCAPEKAGYITACTSAIISLALLIWGIVSFVYTQNPFTILNITVALWMISSSYNLYKLVKAGCVRSHPLFSTVPSTPVTTDAV